MGRELVLVGEHSNSLVGLLKTLFLIETEHQNFKEAYREYRSLYMPCTCSFNAH